MFGTEHLLPLLFCHRAIAVFMHDVAKRRALRLFALFLLLCRVAEDEHRRREHIRRQAQQRAVLLAVFHDITDIARADAKALRCDDGVLRGDYGI